MNVPSMWIWCDSVGFSISSRAINPQHNTHHMCLCSHGMNKIGKRQLWKTCAICTSACVRVRRWNVILVSRPTAWQKLVINRFVDETILLSGWFRLHMFINTECDVRLLFQWGCPVWRQVNWQTESRRVMNVSLENNWRRGWVYALCCWRAPDHARCKLEWHECFVYAHAPNALRNENHILACGIEFVCRAIVQFAWKFARRLRVIVCWTILIDVAFFNYLDIVVSCRKYNRISNIQIQLSYIQKTVFVVMSF